MILELNDHVEIARFGCSRRQVALAAEFQPLARLHTGRNRDRQPCGVFFAVTMANEADFLFRSGGGLFERDREGVAKVGAALLKTRRGPRPVKDIAKKIAEKILKGFLSLAARPDRLRGSKPLKPSKPR